MTCELNLLNYVHNQLREHDDPAAWNAILAVVGEEFTDRYRADGGGNKSWFMRIGTCSHWVRPHQSRWTAAGGFAWPVGYKGASGWSDGLPDFDWSVILFCDGKWWRQVDKFSGKKQIVLRVADRPELRNINKPRFILCGPHLTSRRFMAFEM